MNIELKVEAEIKSEPEIEILNSDNVPQCSLTIEIGNVKLQNKECHRDTDKDPQCPENVEVDTSPFDLEWGTTDSDDGLQCEGSVVTASESSDPVPMSTHSHGERWRGALRLGKRSAVLRTLESERRDAGCPVGSGTDKAVLLNSEIEPRLRATVDQFAILVEFMERHGDIARPSHRLQADRLWKKLSDTLNSVRGGVEKAPEKWRKVWADLKNKTKKKVMVRRYANRTRGTPISRLLTKLEERVLSIMGLLPGDRPGIDDRIIHAQSAGDVSPHPVEQPPASPPPAPPPPAALHAGVDCADMDREEHRVSPTPSTNRDNPPTPPQSPPHVRLPSRRRLLRRQTPFDRAADAYFSVEKRKVKLEQIKEKNLNERENERLRVESRKIDLVTEIKDVLLHIARIFEGFVDRAGV